MNKLGQVIFGILPVGIAVIASKKKGEVTPPVDGEPQPDILITALVLSKNVVEIGETVTITVKLHNYGDAAGDKEVSIWGDVSGSKTVSIVSGGNATVKFEFTPDHEGTYQINTSGFMEMLTALPYAPPDIRIIDLELSVYSIYPDESFQVIVRLHNYGGTGVAVVELGGDFNGTKEINVPEGLDAVVSFTKPAKKNPGSYIVQVGDLTKTLTVLELPPDEPPPANISVGGTVFTYADGSEEVTYSNNFPAEFSHLTCGTYVDAGTEIAVWAVATNTGGQAGNVHISMYANNIPKTIDLTLQPGDKVWVPFIYTAQSPELAVTISPGSTHSRLRVN